METNENNVSSSCFSGRLAAMTKKKMTGKGGLVRRTDVSEASAAAKSLQSCPTLCDPVDGSPPGSPVPGLLQARTLEWAAISFSNASK